MRTSEKGFFFLRQREPLIVDGRYPEERVLSLQEREGLIDGLNFGRRLEGLGSAQRWRLWL